MTGNPPVAGLANETEGVLRVVLATCGVFFGMIVGSTQVAEVPARALRCADSAANFVRSGCDKPLDTVLTAYSRCFFHVRHGVWTLESALLNF